MNQEFIKTDNNVIVNENTIRWVKKINDCMEICSKLNGCFYHDSLSNTVELFRVCKSITPKSYEKLNRHFQEN